MRTVLLLLLLFPFLLFSEEFAESNSLKSYVQYALKQSRPGYVFQITCNLNPEIEQKTMHQNYYFLIDRSTSISKQRFYYNKKAVSAALALLQPGDTFNIIFFGGNSIRLAADPLPWDKENMNRARAFLELQCHGGPFAGADLHTLLDKILPQNVSDNEINTAILLSDGDTYLSSTNQRKIIGKWSQDNKGKVTLFCIASGEGNNLSLLELLSDFNKGDLIYAAKHEQIVERTLELMRTIQNPIGKDLTIEAITSEGATILLQPKNGRLPHLYQNRPITIYGSTNRLTNFNLKIKGRFYDRNFEIEKSIQLTEAHYGSYSIERNWMHLAIQDVYENFFEDGNEKHLQVAKELLAPLNLPVPFLEQNR